MHGVVGQPWHEGGMESPVGFHHGRTQARAGRVTRLGLAFVLCAGFLAAGAGASRPLVGAAASSPAFVEQVAAHGHNITSLTATPGSNLSTGDRLVVQVGVWSQGGARLSTLSDSTGDAFTELTHFQASDATEMSVWTAPVTGGAGARPVVTAVPTARADIGLAVVDYAGLSTAAGNASVDQMAQATGSAATASAGPTAATTTAGDLAVGLYEDSGWDTTLSADPGYTPRVDVSPAGDMEFLVEDGNVFAAGSTPSATTQTAAGDIWLMAVVVFKPGATVQPTVPGTPTGVTASAGNASATVSWVAPANGGSPITSYTVTPIASGTSATPVAVTGSPPPTATTVTGLSNGTSYTFTVSATNAVGTGATSTASNAVTPSAMKLPTFVQQAASHGHNVSSLGVTPTSAVAAGDLLVVEVGVWSSADALVSTVSDSTGDQFSELTHFQASDTTEMSIWTAPVTAGGAKPVVTATPTSAADVGVALAEYAGVSTAGGAAGVDQLVHATGSAATASAGPTPATTAPNELAIGLYDDSGWGASLSGASSYSTRINVSPESDNEFLVEDAIVGPAGSTATATAQTASGDVWDMAVVVLKPGASAPPTVPGAPTNVTASPGNGSATVTWTAPGNGGSPITSYTVTTTGPAAPAPVTVSGTPPATSTTVSGLTNGSSYTFKVAASNAVGTGVQSVASNAVTPANNPGGQWGPLVSWPIVAVHQVLMSTGNVLAWDGWQQPEPTQVWNPGTQTMSTPVNAPDSIFCSGTVQLPDGRVLVVGGYGGLSTGQIGIVDTTVFDPSTSTWSRVANMNTPRWYPDLVELGDGRYVVISGASTNQTTYANTPELYDPVSNTWTNLSGISTSQVHEEEYPFSYLAPNGKVFTIGPGEDVSYWLDANAQTWTSVGSSGIFNGSSVMYRPGKILYSGGAASVTSVTPSQSSARTIDLTAASPAWTATQSMAYARTYHTLTMLADGTVLAVGGEATSDQNTVTTGVLPAEIWNPSTGTWTTVAAMSSARNYHSTAVLMPDGTVLVAGGGHSEGSSGTGQFPAQVYSPPYLFAGSRPTITGAPASTAYGSNMTITTPDAANITAVNLVSLGADTHQADMSQHFVPLSFTTGSGSLTVQAPASGAYAPPGNYMLFIVNSSGVPSVASMVHVAQPATVPGAPTAVTATAGNASATVTWSAPSITGGSAITSYTVTPYIGTTAQTPVVVSGSPPATTTTVGGLANGTTYTFKVTATNSVGTGPPSAASNAVTPANASVPVFVQQTSAHGHNVSALTATPNANLTAGNRLVVEVGVWNASNATTGSVSDSSGDVFTEVTHVVGSDGTELSVWTAPITGGGGVRPVVTATPTSPADTGLAVLEYSGMSSAAGTGAVDQVAGASGASASASSGATAATTAAGELAVGFYSDSGFGAALGAGSGFASRVNVSPTGDMEFLVEDQALTATGAKPSATAQTGAGDVWEMATVVFK